MSFDMIKLGGEKYFVFFNSLWITDGLCTLLGIDLVCGSVSVFGLSG